MRWCGPPPARRPDRRLVRDSPAARRPSADQRPVALHAHFGPVAWAHRRLAQRLDAALIAAFYGADACLRRVVDSATWRRRYRRLFDTVDAVLAEGPSMAERITALGARRTRCTSCGCRRMRTASRGSPGAPKVSLSDRRGRAPHGEEGLDTAIASFARGLRDKRDAELVLLGGGELEAELRQLEQVARSRRPGDLPRAAAVRGVHGRLRSGSRRRVSSRTAANGDSEGGAPVTLIEASWIGVPSVVSDHDDFPFIAGPERSIYISSATVDERAAVLRELYADRARLLEPSQAAPSSSASTTARGRTQWNDESTTRSRSIRGRMRPTCDRPASSLLQLGDCVAATRVGNGCPNRAESIRIGPYPAGRYPARADAGPAPGLV